MLILIQATVFRPTVKCVSSVMPEIGALLFQVVNTQSDEVIFQLPTEIMLNLRKFYAENEPPSIPTFSASL